MSERHDGEPTGAARAPWDGVASGSGGGDDVAPAQRSADAAEHGPDPTEQMVGPAEEAELVEALSRIGSILHWLRVPAVLVALAAAAPAVAIVGLALTWRTWPMVVGLAVGLGALTVHALFVRSALGTARAVRHPGALVADLWSLQRHTTVTVGTAARLTRTVTGSRVRLLGRLAAMWRIVRVPQSVLDHVEDLPALGWLLPPRVVTTWRRTLASFWVGVGGWVLAPVLAGLALTPVL